MNTLMVHGRHSYFSRYGGGAEAHAALRPGWTCSIDGEAWPCEQARADLAASMPARGVAEYMATLLPDVAADLPDLDPEVMFDRFLAWTRQGSPDRVNPGVPGGAAPVSDAT